jgi:hypothetical protein
MLVWSYLIYEWVSCNSVSGRNDRKHGFTMKTALLLHLAKGRKTYEKDTVSRCKITDSIRDLVNICILAGYLGGGDPERRDHHVKCVGR